MKIKAEIFDFLYLLTLVDKQQRVWDDTFCTEQSTCLLCRYLPYYWDRNKESYLEHGGNDRAPGEVIDWFCINSCTPKNFLKQDWELV